MRERQKPDWGVSEKPPKGGDRKSSGGRNTNGTNSEERWGATWPNPATLKRSRRTNGAISKLTKDKAGKRNDTLRSASVKKSADALGFE